MRRSVYILFTLVIISLTGCMYLNKKSNDSVSQETILNAHKTIGYADKISSEARYINGWSTNTDAIITKLVKLSTHPEIIHERSYQSIFASNNNFDQLNESKGESYLLTEVPDILADNYKSFFQTHSKKYIDNKDGLIKMYYAIQSYIEKENYKNDSDSLGKIYADSLQIYYTSMMNTMNNMLNVATSMKDQVEVLTTPDSPIYNLILFMNGELRASEIMLEVFREYNEDKIDKELFQAIFSDYEKVKNINRKEAEAFDIPKNLKLKFDSIINYSDNIAREVDKANQSINKNEKVDPEIFKVIESNYDSIMDLYNDFID